MFGLRPFLSYLDSCLWCVSSIISSLILCMYRGNEADAPYIAFTSSAAAVAYSGCGLNVKSQISFYQYF